MGIQPINAFSLNTLPVNYKPRRNYLWNADGKGYSRATSSKVRLHMNLSGRTFNRGTATFNKLSSNLYTGCHASGRATCSATVDRNFHYSGSTHARGTASTWINFGDQLFTENMSASSSASVSVNRATPIDNVLSIGKGTSTFTNVDRNRKLSFISSAISTAEADLLRHKFFSCQSTGRGTAESWVNFGDVLVAGASSVLSTAGCPVNMDMFYVNMPTDSSSKSSVEYYLYSNGGLNARITPFTDSTAGVPIAIDSTPGVANITISADGRGGDIPIRTVNFKGIDYGNN